MGCRRPTRPVAEPSLIDLLTESLLTAATTLRSRYQAIYELQLEALRRPALAQALAGLADTSTQRTGDHHTALGLPVPTQAIPTLITLYGGTLFTLITTPAEHISQQSVRGLAQAIVHGVLPDLDDRLGRPGPDEPAGPPQETMMQRSDPDR